VAELVVRDVEEIVTQRLQQRAAAHGVSPEEEHRRILRGALLGPEVTRGTTTDFKEYLLSMPDVGEDSDFSRVPGEMREVDFSE
jgi:plasmid stability protein